MSQFQGRSGPIQNDAAPFQADMSAGYQPEQPRLFSSRVHAGGAVSDTFYVPATFTPDMTRGEQPTKNREKLLPHLNWTAWNVESVTFTSDSVEVKRPDSPRLFSTRHAVGWQALQPVQVAVPFTNSMLEASQGALPHACSITNRQGLAVLEAVPDIVVVTPFSIEMVMPPRPDTPMRFVPSRGPSFFPWSGTAAPLTPDMTAGSQPDRSRAFMPLKTGLVAQAPDVPPFSVEMTLGSHPDQPRARRPFPQGWQVAQPTFGPLDAAFNTLDAIRWGTPPERARAFVASKVGGTVSDTVYVAASFTDDMVKGHHPDQSRAWLPVRVGWSVWTPEVVTFSIDSIFAGRPDSPRPFSSRTHQGVQESQLTTVFTIEMTFAARPDQPRLFSTRLHRGWQDGQITPIATVTPDMLAGSHPDQPRLTRTWTQIGWSVNQTTPTAAPFSSAMTAGSHPDQPPPPVSHRDWSVVQVVSTTPPIFRVSWAQGSNRTVGMEILPE